MSRYSVIQDTTIELRRRIHTALRSDPDADFDLHDEPAEDITLAPPADEVEGNPRLSIYLYRIEPDGNLRNQRFLPIGQNGLRYPPLALALHYLITPLDDAEEQNHLMLGRIAQHFHDRPMVDQLNGQPLGDSFGGASPALRVSLEPLTLEQLTQLWSAFDTGLRLSLSYDVRVVAVDTDLALVAASRVAETHTVVGPLSREGES